MNPKNSSEKKLRAVVREIEELKERINNPKSEKLDQPIQKGWKRFYVLTDHTKMRKDRPVLEEILQEIGTVRFFWRRSFRKGKRTRKHLVEIGQRLSRIHPSDWQKKGFSKKWAPYFFERIRFRQTTVYQFLEPSLFKLKTDRHWLTHIWVLDIEAIQRKAELQRWMESHRGWNRYWRLKGRSNHWFYSRPQKLDREARMDLNRQIIETTQPELIHEIPLHRGSWISWIKHRTIREKFMKPEQPTKIPYPLKLKTRRLCLCSLTPRDGKALNRAVQESFPELNRWLPWIKNMPSVEETEKFAKEASAKFILNQDYTFRLVLAGKRIPIGCIGLHPREMAVPSYEIGYWLHSAYTGQGYMTEAVRALVVWARDVAGARRLVIRADTRNEASWSIPKKAGFRLEGVHRHQVRDNAGKLADMRIHALVFADKSRRMDDLQEGSV